MLQVVQFEEGLETKACAEMVSKMFSLSLKYHGLKLDAKFRNSHLGSSGD